MDLWLFLQIQSAHSELQRETSKQQALLDAKTKRIKELENVLKEMREAADKEYQRLQMEKEQIRTTLTAKLREKESECVCESVYAVIHCLFSTGAGIIRHVGPTIGNSLSFFLSVCLQYS